MGTEEGGGYLRIRAQSPRDARLYVLSERLVMILGVAFLVVGVTAVATIGNHLGAERSAFLGRVAMVMGPLFAAFVFCIWLHRRVARKYGML